VTGNDRDTLRANRGEQGLVEMQPRGWRGDRARRARVDRLVARLVLGCRRVRDVGRQRHLAAALERVEHVTREAQLVELALAPEHLRLDAVA
jgi:hypothetical protein